MNNDLDLIAKKIKIDNVDTTPPEFVVKEIAGQVEPKTQGYLKCIVQMYNGKLESYKETFFTGLLDRAKPQKHDVQENLGEMGYVFKKYEMYLTAVNLPHYKFRVLLFEYGIGGYPVKVVLEQRISNSIRLPNYVVTVKDRNELEELIFKALTSSKAIEVMQDLINATLLQSINAENDEVSMDT